MAPSLTWRPNADTTFTLSAYYQKDPDGGYFNSVYPKFLAPSKYKDDLGHRFNVGDPAFDAFEREQHGIGYQHTRSNWQYNWGPAPSINVANPQYGQLIGPLTTIIDSGQTLRQTGAYVQDQFRFGGFRALLVVRHDWTEQDSDNRLAKTSSNPSSEAISYRVGLLYLFDNGLAPYVSYATSFDPNIGVNASGSPFVPSKARQYEVGLKYQPTGVGTLFTVRRSISASATRWCPTPSASIRRTAAFGRAAWNSRPAGR